MTSKTIVGEYPLASEEVTMMTTREKIEALMWDAHERGDAQTAALCQDALEYGPGSFAWREAERLCAK